MLVAALLGAACATRPPLRATLVGEGGAIPPAARAALPGIESAYAALFGVTAADLSIELVMGDAERPEYDHFDQGRNVVRMGWPAADEALGLWTLAHEVAHAYEFAHDAVAYEDEPSWIHEGLAEYAVWAWKRALDPAEGERFLRAAARDHRASGAPFREVFADVYAFDWSVAYPPCHLAVHVLARDTGREGVLRYFREHGAGRPDAALRRVAGLGPRELERRVDALACALDATR